MQVSVDHTGTVEALSDMIGEVAAHAHVQALMVFTCDANGFTPTKLDPVLRSAPLPLIGGVFPALIHDGRKLENGTIVAGVEAPLSPLVIRDLSDSNSDFEQQFEKQVPDPLDAETVLVLLDGFATRIDSFVETAFSFLGLDLTYVGGGAGSLSMERGPCLLTGEGMVADAAVLGLLEAPSTLGVSHGWTEIAGPFQVTSSHGTVIRTLDWQPAFEVYRDAIAAADQAAITVDEFFEVARAYPFGISKMGTERVVRDPFAVQDDGSIVCVGAVPNGSFVHVLHGDQRSLIHAAARAREQSAQGVQGSSTASADPAGPADPADPRSTRLVFDCISRVLFLDDRFPDELAAISDGGGRVLGVCSIGEVANNGDSYLEFFNKTTVVASLGDTT